ncbi:unnamed protein product [Staurois parvus]|uniref:Uncharacterized protein n=1 Tax=Staurois parvus TaxID=386267 RepID=A0ABN9C098_9NEOB|nr:unnamed protein product [Staurois parvus]
MTVPSIQRFQTAVWSECPRTVRNRLFNDSSGTFTPYNVSTAAWKDSPRTVINSLFLTVP